MGGRRAKNPGTVKKEDIGSLLDDAADAAGRAYAPYSKVRVGAAALAVSGKVYTGCNVENASSGLTVCAERTAVQNAVSAGEREIVAVAVFSPDISCITPCGACRQVMAEFATRASPGLLVIVERGAGCETMRLGELLPRPFVSSGVRKGNKPCH
jgi:cytidine deaminase